MEAIGRIPESAVRVQAPSAPGFYRSCAAALTDGFRPQSGLVQREFLKPPFGGKTVKQRLRRERNAPLFPLRGAST